LEQQYAPTERHYSLVYRYHYVLGSKAFRHSLQ